MTVTGIAPTMPFVADDAAFADMVDGAHDTAFADMVDGAHLGEAVDVDAHEGPVRPSPRNLVYIIGDTAVWPAVPHVKGD